MQGKRSPMAIKGGHFKSFGQHIPDAHMEMQLLCIQVQGSLTCSQGGPYSCWSPCIHTKATRFLGGSAWASGRQPLLLHSLKALLNKHFSLSEEALWLHSSLKERKEMSVSSSCLSSMFFSNTINSVYCTFSWFEPHSVSRGKLCRYVANLALMKKWTCKSFTNWMYLCAAN